ncbi:hypothetical protein LQ948_14950 [Jiella sp. MQZ9-1]|uniref:DUF5615 domain-containing protein n=1 Tax=Jiella flava TaxID=2816857 RepID=A0A939G051_9HYPH|nr:hypothetical protein [Jiella flava]MBO0663931.1 hypothetical protein [Jiella flava]MCD2472503.1 hypothetical protein [Jiella flava]
MKALLDGNLPARLAVPLLELGCDVASFLKASKGLNNGELLKRLHREGFACLITVDKNIPYQQAVKGHPLAVLVTPSPRFGNLEPLLPNIAAALNRIQPDGVWLIAKSGSLETIKPKKT